MKLSSNPITLKAVKVECFRQTKKLELALKQADNYKYSFTSQPIHESVGFEQQLVYVYHTCGTQTQQRLAVAVFNAKDQRIPLELYVFENGQWQEVKIVNQTNNPLFMLNLVNALLTHH